MRFVPFLSLVVLVAACGGGSSGPTPKSGESGGGSAGESGGAGEKGGDTASGGDQAGEKGDAKGPAPEALDPALPETLKDAKPFARRHECPKTGCNLKLVVPDELRPKADDKAPVVMWEEVMPPKAMLLFPRHSGLDVYAVLIDGEISAMADDIKGKQLRVWKNGGFRAPGAGVNVFAKEPTRIVFAAVVAGKDGSVAGAIDQIDKKEKVAWTKRPAPVTGFELGAVKPLSWGGGAYHARPLIEDAPASLGLLMMSKNAPVAEHTHDKEWEFLAIVEGAGTLTKKGGDVPVAGATFAAVPPGTPHGFKAGGSAATVALQLYWPPGPEQRFKKLAEGGK